jgi:hypothetical protein
MAEFGVAMTVKDVWHYLNGDKPDNGSVFPREKVREMMKRGRIKSYVKGGTLFTLRASVDAYVAEISLNGDPNLDIIPLR